MTDPSVTPDHSLERLIDPELRKEIGDPVPVTFAASVVYIPLFVVGIVLACLWTESLSGPGYAPGRILADVAIGAGAAVALTFLTFGLAVRIRALQELEVEFRRVLGSLGKSQILRLAALSGATEEIVFRGVLLPLFAEERFLGLGATQAVLWTSLIFGALHFLPHKVFLPWTVFALLIGLLTGALFAWRDSLVAPTTLHVVLNALNLHLISTGRRLMGAPGPPEPV
jgi:membrane protease YdiL (CAAX protease family)